MTGQARPATHWAAAWPREIGTATDRLAAIAAMAVVVSWAVTHRYSHGGWWSTVLLAASAALLLLLLAGRLAGRPALIVAILAGIAERFWRTPFRESDALPAVREAIQTLLAGQDPYTHLTLATQPLPTHGFAYPPGALLVYLPAMPFTADLRVVERITSVLIVLLLGSLAWRAGAARAALAVALFGVFELAGFRALDGSNDTTLTFLVLAAFVALLYAGSHRDRRRWLFWGSIVPLALAILFKQLAWPIAFFLLLALWRSDPHGRRYVVATVGLVVLVALPFVAWDPVAFISGPFLEPFKHKDTWGANLWSALDELRPGIVAALGPIPSVMSLVALLGSTATLVRRGPRDIAGALPAGIAVLLVTLVFARWTTSVYYIFAYVLSCAVIALAPLDRQPVDLRR